jgi:hypothetical protein
LGMLGDDSLTFGHKTHVMMLLLAPISAPQGDARTLIR